MSAGLIQIIRALVVPPSAVELPDRDLLRRFVTRGEEAAFTALVKRHGPMVLGICRRVLRNASDTEDAFQATFLILVRKAGTIGKPDLLGNWLYGVAYRTALKARQRRQRDRALAGRTAQAVFANLPPDDLGPVMDEEVSRLPEKYRAPFILCCLEGITNVDAARLLGCPHGTVLSRLARARARLRVCLTRRGLAPAVALGALVLEKNLAPAALPLALVLATVQSALQFATGQVLSKAPVLVLAKGVLKSMFMTKLKTVTVLVSAFSAVSLGAGVPLYRAFAAPGNVAGLDADDQQPAPPPETELAAALAAEETSAQEAGPRETLKGSGKVITKEINVADFSRVEAGQAFLVEIVKGDAFSTKITIDDNLFPEVMVVKEGTTLRIGFNTKKSISQQGPSKVSVTMPHLEGIKLSGASKATLKGFDSAKEFAAKLEGASQLAGDMKAAKVNLALTGASKVKLQGSAKEGTLSATGASVLDLKDYNLASADARLSGASKATVTVLEKLDYNLSGASQLTIRGNPTLGKKGLSGASRVHMEK